MKRTLLTACVAALSLTACQKEAPPRSVARVAPVKVAAPKPVPPITRTVAAVVPDAGSPVEAPPVDLLAVAHPTDHVDHLTRAQQLRVDGDLPGALAEARRAVADDGNDEDALMLIGKLGRMTGADALAAEAYARVAALEPLDASPLVQEARVLIHAHAFRDAVEVAQAAVARDDAEPEAYQALGRAYLSQGMLQPAIDSFEKVIALQPEHGYALNNLGLAYLRANRNSDAVEVLKQASMLLPDIAYVQNNLGIALERTGDTDDAQAAYARAMSLSPKYLKARLNSGRLQRVASAELQTAPEFSEVPDEVTLDALDDVQ